MADTFLLGADDGATVGEALGSIENVTLRVNYGLRDRNALGYDDGSVLGLTLGTLEGMLDGI